MSDFEADDQLTLWRGNAVGSFTSPRFSVPAFDRAVMTWRCSGAAKFFLEVNGGSFLMGEWGAEPRSFKTADVSVDLLMLKTPATEFRFRVEPSGGTTLLTVPRASRPATLHAGGTPAVRFVAVTHWLSTQIADVSDGRSAAWGKTLDVPPRSQYAESKDPNDICSPTSVAMLLDFYGVKKSTREVADAVFDHAQKIYGNWSFNTAFINSLPGFEACVKRARSLADLETEIAAGRPAIISHRWNEGELGNAPIPKTNGHLIVVVGFTGDGDLIVNDPAGRGDDVRRVYKRSQIQHTWLERAAGIMYLVRNKG